MSDTVSITDNERMESLSDEEQKQLDADIKELAPEDQEKEEPEEQVDEDEDDGEPDVDPEREAIRQRRRQERQDKKKHRLEKEDSYKREIDALRRQLSEVNEWKNTVERRHVDTGVQQIDKAIGDAQSAIDLAKQAIKEATANQDGDGLIEAQDLYYAARKRQEDLARLKHGIAQRMSAPPQQNVDPVVVNNAKAWMDNKSWYDPTGQDMDSRIALQIDNQMAQEGWNPRDPSYWEELDSRLTKYLPHRFTNQNSGASMSSNEQPRRNKPPTSGSGQGKSAPSSNEYRLSPERVRAMKEAGMWDDPDKRKRMIKRYMEQDKSQG